MTNPYDRIIDQSSTPEDVAVELSLRPSLLDEFVGQFKVKDNLKLYIEAAKQRHECLDHILIFGPPGLGKTTLAQIIAKELQVDCKVTSAPALDKKGDLAALLTSLKPFSVLFIECSKWKILQKCTKFS